MNQLWTPATDPRWKPTPVPAKPGRYVLLVHSRHGARLTLYAIRRKRGEELLGQAFGQERRLPPRSVERWMEATC